MTEQIESTQEAFEAGAAICHAHVRNDDETPSSDPEKFASLLEGHRRHCPGMIVQFSTGGCSGAGSRFCLPQFSVGSSRHCGGRFSHRRSHLNPVWKCRKV